MELGILNDPIFSLITNDEYLLKKGSTSRDRAIYSAKRKFKSKVVSNPGYIKNAFVNGVTQQILVDRTDSSHKCQITTFPGEPIFPGDMVDFWDNKWIVVETWATNAIQTVGIAWLCNNEFSFQTFSSDIHKIWGVLDRGVYSTTRTSDPIVPTLDMQYKIYLPLTDETRLLHEDQRLATDRWVDKKGNKILLTYAITAADGITDNYVEGSHLLILNVRSSSYNPNKDNYEKMICDYISPSDVQELPNCIIEGRNYIRIGSSRTYSVGNILCGEESTPMDIVPEWSLNADNGIVLEEHGRQASISIPDVISYVGSRIELTLSDKSGKYSPGMLEIEVTT